QPSPDGVALGPEVLALVVEALAKFIDGDSERDRVQPRGNAPVESRRPGVERHRVEPFRIARAGGALIEQAGKYSTVVVGRAADDVVVDGVAPVASQPVAIGLDPTTGHQHGSGGDLAPDTVLLHDDSTHAVARVEHHVFYGGFVLHLHAHRLSGLVVRIEQRLTTTQKAA